MLFERISAHETNDKLLITRYRKLVAVQNRMHALYMLISHEQPVDKSVEKIAQFVYPLCLSENQSK